MQLRQSPSLSALYARAAFSRKPALVPPGRSVAKLEGSLEALRLDPAHLERYRELVGWKTPDVPLTYPHVLASGLHLSLLTSAGFPVRLLGLVHLANRIEQRASLDVNAEVRVVATLEGHRDTERGQEFELHTELHVGGAVPWREVSTFLARKQRTGPKSTTPREARPTPQKVITIDAPVGLGRRYGRVAGDLNPIHVSDVTAKLFGFPRAIAHGMWSLGRCAAELELCGAGSLDVQFKLPLFLPSQGRLEVHAGGVFWLTDERGEKPHLTGAWLGG